MAIRVITTVDGLNPDKDPTEDVVYRQRMARLEVTDPTEEFKTAQVSIEYGDAHKDEKGRMVHPVTELTLRYAYDSPFIFCTIKDNPAWSSRPRDLWQAVARDGIEKFFAMAGVQVKMAPKPEDSNRYNLMAEADRPIEFHENTVRRFQEIEAENAKAREAAVAKGRR